MSREKRGSLLWSSSGSVNTLKGTPVDRDITFRRKRYSLVGATGSRKEAERSAAGYRRQFGGAVVRRIEPGNFAVYAGGTFGK